MAKLTLQEQLLKSGLVNAGQARAVKTEKNKQAKQQQHNKALVVDGAKEQAQKARLAQAEKDRELNQQRKQEEERKQLAAQVKQLIEQNRLPQDSSLAEEFDDSLAYHFNDNNKVKALFVAKAMREKIADGQLAIVKLGQQYEVVTAEIALKIKARDVSFIVVFNEPNQPEEVRDDPYADYQVPDDLMW